MARLRGKALFECIQAKSEAHEGETEIARAAAPGSEMLADRRAVCRQMGKLQAGMGGLQGDPSGPEGPAPLSRLSGA